MANVAINNITDTWNSSGTTFTGIKFNVTDTSSAAASLLMDLQVGGASKFKVAKDGTASASGGGDYHPNFRMAESPSLGWLYKPSNAGMYAVYNSQPMFRITQSEGRPSATSFGFYGGSWTNASDVVIFRDAANTLAQANGVNAQTFRLYGTHTDASNYRRVSLSMDTAGTADLKAEGAGTGVTGNILRVEAAAYRLASNAVITDSSTARTLTAADNGRVIYFTSATAVTVTTAVGLGTGFTCTLIQGGAGQITVAADASTAVVSYGSFTKTAGQYAAISAMCPVADTFYLSGDLA